MRFGKILAAVAASSMIVAPAMAAPANPAGSLSIANATGARAGSTMKNASTARGKKGSGFIVALAFVAGVVAIIVIASVKNNNNNDRPTSR